MNFLQSQEHPDLVGSQISSRGDSLQSPPTPQAKPKGPNMAVVKLLKYTTVETSFGVSGQRNPLHKAPQPLAPSRKIRNLGKQTKALN